MNGSTEIAICGEIGQLVYLDLDTKESAPPRKKLGKVRKDKSK